MPALGPAVGLHAEVLRGQKSALPCAGAQTESPSHRAPWHARVSTHQQWPRLWVWALLGKWPGREGPGPVFLRPCADCSASDHSCPLDVTCCSTCGTFWSGLVTWGGGSAAWVGSYHLPALPCSLLTKQEDRTSPAWAASAGDGPLQPPRLAWGEDTPVASGRPDAGGQLAESHGHMGQGNQQGSSSGSRGQTPPPWWARAARGSSRLRVRHTCVLVGLARAV